VTRLEHVNSLIHRFGDGVRSFFRDQQRSSMTSPMFNLPGRLVLGSHCYHEQLPALLPEILQRADAASIGRRMRRLCARPNLVHVNSLALGYLVGREQSRLMGGSQDDDFETVASVMEFWEGVALSSREDGHCLPEESGGALPSLTDADVEEFASNLRDDLSATLRARIRRLLATFELYTFILHGEARVGVFHHGPYALPDGDCLVVKELIGLREDYYPWAGLASRLPIDHLACVMRLRGVRPRLVMFGTLTTEPRDYVPHIVSEALFAVEADTIRPLADVEIDDLTALAARAQMDLYRQLITWDDRYRVAYGAELYGGLLKSFADDLGFGEAFGRTIRERFADSVQLHLQDLCSGVEPPRVLEHIAATQGPMFAPLMAREARAC
jgi:hypothetical protein